MDRATIGNERGCKRESTNPTMEPTKGQFCQELTTDPFCDPVPHFVDGAVLGSREFVNTVFTAERHRYGPRRKDGARKIQALESPKEEALFDLRDIRKRAIG